MAAALPSHLPVLGRSLRCPRCELRLCRGDEMLVHLATAHAADVGSWTRAAEATRGAIHLLTAALEEEVVQALARERERRERRAAEQARSAPPPPKRRAPRAAALAAAQPPW